MEKVKILFAKYIVCPVVPIKIFTGETDIQVLI